MRKTAIVLTAALGIVTFAGTAAADDGPTGIELGARLGYGIPLGSATGDSTVNGQTVKGASMSDTISGMIPIWLDAGYRFTPNLMAGIGFLYGFGSVPSSQAECSQNGVSCSIHDLMFMIQGQYHIMPVGPLDPWVGLGLGYESLGLSASAGGQSASQSVSSLPFLMLQGGADYKVMPALGVGPFVALSFGQYSSISSDTPNAPTSIDNKAFHEWLIFGVRGTYDIALGQ
jgi:outer membrane protein W